MAEILQGIICPNCGANTQNTNYCEYCGSKIVRLSETIPESDVSKPIINQMVEYLDSFRLKHPKLSNIDTANETEFIFVKMEVLVCQNGGLGGPVVEVKIPYKFDCQALKFENKPALTPYIYICLKKDSEAYNKLYDALADYSNKSFMKDVVIGDKPCVEFSTSFMSLHDESWTEDKNKMAYFIRMIYGKVFGVAPQNLRFHYCFLLCKEKERIEEFFDANGNPMSPLPILPSTLRVFGDTPVQRVEGTLQDVRRTRKAATTALSGSSQQPQGSTAAQPQQVSNTPVEDEQARAQQQAGQKVSPGQILGAFALCIGGFILGVANDNIFIILCSVIGIITAILTLAIKRS